MTAYYNECDPFAAAWLRELIKANLIAPGDVDERDIRDVTPNDIATYDQCHFFAGIGTWSYALRQAGWPDNQSVWTGSCPCQPFSTAGTRVGFDDERHLWPSWFWLISQSKPSVIFGEQVSSRDGLAWLDLVQTDLEASGYAVGPLDLCAAGVGAPHKRQRLFFVADNLQRRLQRQQSKGTTPATVDRKGIVCNLAYAQGRGTATAQQPGQLCGLEQGGFVGNATINRDGTQHRQSRQGWQQQEQDRGSDISGGVAHAQEQPVNRIGGGIKEQRQATQQEWDQSRSDGTTRSMAHSKHDGGWPEEQGRREKGRASDGGRGPANGFWRDTHWVWCGDPDGPRWRAVEPGTFPLAHGATARMGRLRGYGNAIVAPLATEFIKAYMEFQNR